MTLHSQLTLHVEQARKTLDIALANMEQFMHKSWARERIWRLLAAANEQMKMADECLAKICELETRVPDGR